VVGGISCAPQQATFDCHQPQVYDLEADLAEDQDLAASHPALLAALAANFSAWYASIQDSRANESKCRADRVDTTAAALGGAASSRASFPTGVAASAACSFEAHAGLAGGAELAVGSVASREACCAACRAYERCEAAEFVAASPMRPTFEGVTSGGTCRLSAGAAKAAAPRGAEHTVCFTRAVVEDNRQ